jgi:Asp-tRNA(Asn)/Glu-tRNA(Gln) amidotransferase A subunit family amidase
MMTVRYLYTFHSCWYSANCLDTADLLDGAPVGIQIIGQRLQEETVLALSEEISRELGRGQVPRL